MGGNSGLPRKIETGSAIPDPGTAFGRTSDENVIEPCRPLSFRCHVDDIAKRYGSLANRNYQPASQHHGRSAEAGRKARGKTTEGAAGGKHRRSSPDITSPSNATDIGSKAGVRFSDGEDCCA
jgi:hypothetical protein